MISSNKILSDAYFSINGKAKMSFKSMYMYIENELSYSKQRRLCICYIYMTSLQCTHNILTLHNSAVYTSLIKIAHFVLEEICV